MKKIISALLIAVICLSLASCGSGSDVKVPNGMKLASNETDIFYLFVPNSWSIDRGHGYPYAYYSMIGGESDATDSGSAENTSANDVNKVSDSSNVTVILYNLKNEVMDTVAENENPRTPYVKMFLKEFTEEATSALPEFKIIETNENADLGTLYAHQIIYTHKIGNTVYKHRSIFTYYSSNIMVCLTYTALEKNYDAHAEEVDKIISEFKFK